MYQKEVALDIFVFTFDANNFRLYVFWNCRPEGLLYFSVFPAFSAVVGIGLVGC